MGGGLGKRMNSELPKVLHKVYSTNKEEYPMLVHVIKKAEELNPEKIFIIVGKYHLVIDEQVKKYAEIGVIKSYSIIEYVIQETPLGTGHAIHCTIPKLDKWIDHQAIILSGDVPLITLQTLQNLISDTNKILITELDNPKSCGRIIFNNDNLIQQIIEEKDANYNEQLIKFVNCGIYQIKVKDLINLIPKIQANNKANEYYLTDIIQLMVENNIPIGYYNLPKELQYTISNINTKIDIDNLNNLINKLNNNN